MQAAFTGLQDIPMRVNRINLAAVNLLSEGRSFEAAGLLQQALSLDPRDPFTLNNLGAADEAIGDLGGAMKYYTAAANSQSHEAVAVTLDRSWQGKSVSEMAAANAMRLERPGTRKRRRVIREPASQLAGSIRGNENDWATAKAGFHGGLRSRPLQCILAQ